MDLLERSAQINLLNRHFQEAARGQGRLILIGGEAGVGKTSLVQAFCQQAHALGQVIYSSCDALSTPGPFGPLHDIAPALGPEVEQLLATGGTRDQLFYAVLNALRDRSEPVVIVGEDAHWSDGATLDLVRFLARRIGTTRVLFIVTYRDDEVGPHHPLRLVLGDLATESSTVRMTVEPLSLEGVRALTAGSQYDADLLYRQSGGNPFFVTEILAAGGDGIPTTVSDTILARAARLSPEARSVLDVAAVIGTTIDAQLLVQVAGPVVDALEECIEHGLLFSAADGVMFRHELTRQAILESIIPPRRQLLHARVLSALREHSAESQDMALLAHHAEGAGDRAAVLEFAIAAADQASAMSAHREAAAQYARALGAAVGLPDADRVRLLEARSFACYLSDQGQAAIAARLDAIAIWKRLGDRLREGDNLRWLSRIYWFEGRNAEAEEAARAVQALLSPLPPGPELAMAYSNLAQLRMLASDLHGTIEWGERAIALANQLQEHEILVHSLTNVGTARLYAADERGREDLERSLQLATEAGFVDHVGRALTNLVWTAIWNMRLDEAEQRLAAALAYTTEHDLDNYRLYLIATRALLRCYRGDWDDALDSIFHLLLRSNLSPLTHVVALNVRGRILARRGDPGAQEVLNSALSLAEQTGELQRLGPVRSARIEAAWLVGDWDGARSEISAIRDLVASYGNPWIKGEISGWLHRLGDAPVPEEDIAEPYRWQISGDWLRAGDLWDELGYPYDAACARMESSDPEEVRRAFHVFAHLEARPAMTLAMNKLRELGVRDIPRGPRGPRPSTRTNPAGLTQREMDVLICLTEGLRNAEIADRLYLTPKTVAHHVSAILAKLKVSSRTQAAHRAAQLGIVLAKDGSSPM